MEQASTQAYPPGWSLAPDNDGFIGHVGPLLITGETGSRRYGFLARDKHANLLGVVQGGMLMSLADRALGLVGWEDGGQPCVTVQFDMQFVASARIGEFVEVAPQVVRRTRSMLFLRGDLHADGRLVAAAAGVWRILPAAKRPSASGTETKHQFD